MEQSPDAVFAVASDPWRFADWVVGAKKIRNVDANVAGDRQPVPPPVRRRPPQHRRLHRPGAARPAQAHRPAGPRPPGRRRPRATIDLVPAAGGTEVHIEEHPVSGVAERIDNPLLTALIVARNRRSLRRLEKLVAGG